MRHCKTCGKPLYHRNKSGYCKPCFHVSPDGIAHTLKAVAASTAARLKPGAVERLARYRIIRGVDECWGWTGCDNGVGYPRLTFHKRQTLASHLALESDGRPRPSLQHVACHSCDNPVCTNPAHLWWGTEKENMQDASVKGRLKGNRLPRVRRGAVQ